MLLKQIKTVVCSLCSDIFPGPKELGLHILAAHCRNNQESETNLVVIGDNSGIKTKMEDTEGRDTEVMVEAEDKPVDPLDKYEKQVVVESIMWHNDYVKI